MTLPITLMNFTLADATQVMTDLLYLDANSGGTFTGTAGVNVGGISSGTVFTAQNLQQMMTALLSPPYASPAFTATGISGVATSVEVGLSFGPSVNFTWSTSNSINVEANSINLTDITLSTTIATGLANTGSSAQTLAGAVTRTTAGNHQFGFQGENTNLVNFNSTLTINWLWTLYYGPSTNATLSAANILALASSTLASGYAGTFVETAAGFKYLCLADAAGGQINSVKDSSTGFNIPMATSADNAAYSNVDGGGFSYALVSVTNAHSVTTNVRVYRSTNSLGGAVTLLVT